MADDRAQSTLFTNVRVLDGNGHFPVNAEVLVQGNRIKEIAQSTNRFQRSSDQYLTVNAGGATLMPGLCDAHTHFSWNTDSLGHRTPQMPRIWSIL
jgi:predicted amidohydrolase YtcJ